MLGGARTRAKNDDRILGTREVGALLSGKMETGRSREEVDRHGSDFNGNTRALSSCILHGLRAPWCCVIAGGDGMAQACLRSAGDEEASA